jgi:hypothetical protein
MTTTGELKNQALRVAGQIDPDIMTGAQAAAAVKDLAIAEKALAGTLLFVALRVAKTNAWQGQGFATPADWLASMVGISVYEANRQLGTARKANGLGKTKKAMRDGSISPDQADAVTDAATADPSAEDDLLDLAARDTTRSLREEAARRKAAATGDAARERRIHRERSLRRYVDRDGAFNLHLRGTAADGAKIEALLRPHEEQAFRTGRADGIRDSFENRSYDAMLSLLGLRAAPPAASATASGSSGASKAGAADAAAAPAPAKVPGGENVKVIVTVDHTALLRGHTIIGETCQIAGVGPISVEAVRQILRDDPFLAVVVKKGRDVVNVAHHGRGLNAHQRTAIETAGIRCTNIVCNRTIAIQIDHRTPYATDPVTKLDNADPLCSGTGSCHDLKTHHGHLLEPGTGRRRLLPPDHPDHPGNRGPDEQPHHQTPRRTASGIDPPPRIEQPTLC